MVEQVKTRMIAAEFFELPESNQPTELIDGELIMSPTPVPQHQRLVFRSGKLIEILMPGGEVFIAPLEVHLGGDAIPQPDVVWVAPDSRCVVAERRLEGAPDLVVGVLSPGSARYDKSVKLRLYERYGVREYWIVDPANQLVEGLFQWQGAYGPGDTFESAVLGGKAADVSAVFGS